MFLPASCGPPGGRLRVRERRGSLPVEQGRGRCGQGQPLALEAELAELQDLADAAAIGPSTRAVVEAARRRGIPVFRVTEDASLFQLGWGKHARRIQATITGHTSNIAVDIAQDKDLTKALLAEAGLPVPRGQVAHSAEQAIDLEDDEALSGVDALLGSEMAAIRHALLRLETGDYGRCARCGGEIAAARLDAQPTAALCIGCAESNASAR